MDELIELSDEEKIEYCRQIKRRKRQAIIYIEELYRVQDNEEVNEQENRCIRGF